MSSPQGVTNPSLDWRISSRCNGGGCVQVAFADNMIVVRDSKHPDNGMLRYSHSEWLAFTRAVKQGAYDLA
ncbi:hypothetical protein GCM10010156_19910 [Planobispora rosea]|uniref:DUF397 domain-containing protein n=1 Tax=Planobispora rosea TaxID=35762 RepID=A0A8J3RZ11_PLARO|nr:DUF397 domain-containing protein [Planobispora rosea]GGS61154.1 hypothetical protein GCM10010156_19910 [Planobispora rosea]GIH83910.1 hypothetical protein Pro02_23180 [Planobispora rosea]